MLVDQAKAYYKLLCKLFLFYFFFWYTAFIRFTFVMPVDRGCLAAGERKRFWSTHQKEVAILVKCTVRHTVYVHVHSNQPNSMRYRRCTASYTSRTIVLLLQYPLPHARSHQILTASLCNATVALF